MRTIIAAFAALLVGAAPSLHAAPLTPEGTYIRDCLTAAGSVYDEPPSILVILLNVEGGRLGAVSPNTNGTVDIGPMQVNDIWVPKVAAHWRTDVKSAYLALRDNFCANVEAGAWILRMGLDEAHGNFWEGVGIYHSHDPDHKRTYLSSVLKQALRLQGRAHAVQPGAGTGEIASAATERPQERQPTPAPVPVMQTTVSRGY